MQLAGLTACTANTMNSNTTATFTNTMTLLKFADSLMPITSSVVTRPMMITAGRLKIAVAVVPSAQCTMTPRAAERAHGTLMPTSCRNDTTYPDQPIATVTAPSAYSSTRSHPMIQAISFAQRRVPVRVGAPRHGHEGGELGVAQRGEDGCDPCEDEREHDRRTGVQGGDGAGQDKDPGPDDGADAEHRQIERAQRSLQTMVGKRFRLQVGDAFPAEQIHAGLRSREVTNRRCGPTQGSPGAAICQ